MGILKHCITEWYSIIYHSCKIKGIQSKLTCKQWMLCNMLTTTGYIYKSLSETHGESGANTCNTFQQKFNRNSGYTLSRVKSKNSLKHLHFSVVVPERVHKKKIKSPVYCDDDGGV